MIIPTFLSDLVRTVVIMSVTGGVISLLLFAVKPIVRHRLPKSVQHYFWLVALLAFVAPFSLITLPDTAVNIPSIHNVVERNVISLNEETERLIRQSNAPYTPASPALIQQAEPIYIPPAPYVIASTLLMLIYPWAALAILTFNLIGYRLFANKLRKSYIPVHQEELDLLTQLSRGKGKPQIYRSTIAATPMLIGIFRPTIVLPNRKYTETHLHSILFHELTHMRRFDIAIKWLSLAACALHWFNPLAWLARREIDRTCELSCDEIVIRGMGIEDKQDYGNTLIHLATDTKIPSTVLSTTMCQEKRALKERLTSIMKSKRYTKLAVFASMVIILAVTLAACTLGVGRSGNNAQDSIDQLAYNNDTDEDISLSLPPMPMQEHHANQHIYYTAQNIHTSPYVRIVNTRIDLFEKIAEFDHIFPDSTIQLWRLHFAIQIEVDSNEVRWGSFEPDERGWISQATSFNDANTILAFIQKDEALTFHGAIPWYMDFGGSQTPWTAEITARAFFESISYLPPVTFPGNHYIAYFDLGGQETGRILLSQPIVQGDGGIWIVDRWYFVGDLGSHSTNFTTPQSGTLSMLEFYASLQAQYDEGHTPELADPYAVARTYLNSWGWDENYAPIIRIDPIETPT